MRNEEESKPRHTMSLENLAAKEEFIVCRDHKLRFVYDWLDGKVFEKCIRCGLVVKKERKSNERKDAP